MTNNMQALIKLKDKKGVTAVLTAIMIVMFLGFSALAIDIGYGMVTKNELQNIADSAALAATRQLGVIYQNLTYAEQVAYVLDPGDETLIKNAAIDVASQNKAGGKNDIVIKAEDIFIGKWNTSPTPGSFSTPTPNLQPNAVRVIARRDGLANGQITTFFATIFGITGRDVTAQATAAMTGQSTSDPGELELPVGISRYFFDTNTCGDHVAFSPANSPESCAGWTSWEYNSNDANLRKILEENPQYLSPETLAYDSNFNFIGGQMSNPTFDALLTLFRIKGYDIDINGDPVLLDADGKPVADAGIYGVPLCENNSLTDCSVPCDATHTTRLYYDADKTMPRNLHEWPTTVVVYENGDGAADCSNPNQDKRIVGFARITMDDVCNSPDKIIRGIVQCNYVEPTDDRGGGGNFGVLGPIPGLVE
ncbi:MAG: pilus assembly protein TadG-related protein [Thermodesulfovibrionales bacterium]